MHIQTIIDIVRGAASLMLTDSLEITQKGDCTNIVTSADLAVQRYLIDHLSEVLPGSGFICEEGDIMDMRHDKVWIIDPIDGTANFSRGIDQCAIAVGLYYDGCMQMGVVYIPRTGELFSAVRGQGAYLNGRRIHVSDRPFANGIMCTALPVYRKQYTQVCSRIITEVFLRCNDIRRFGAAAPELCYLAMGRCELYFEYRLSAWDFAAASLILQEAGGVVCATDGSPLDPTRHSGVLAANCQASLDILTDIVKEKIQESDTPNP